MNTVTGTITKLDRLRNSASGNPRYLVTLDNGTSYRTAKDAAINHMIPNPEYQGRPITFELSADTEIVGEKGYGKW